MIDILNAHRYDSVYISISLDQRSCSWLHIHQALPLIEDLRNVQHKIERPGVQVLDSFHHGASPS